jgi:hypothetical protein
MARLIFFLLLIANVALGAHIFLDETRPKAAVPREVNPGALKIVSVTDPGKAQQDAIAARKLAAALTGSACVDFGVRPADSARAQASFTAMNLGARISSRTVEEFSRFTVTLPPQKDKRTAEVLVASLKKAGVKDVSALADNTISLGVFSSDEAAQRAVADVNAKAKALVKDVQVTPRNSQPKETLFTVREPDTNIVARLTLMQREYDGSNLRAVACPPAAASASTVPAPQATADTVAPAKK